MLHLPDAGQWAAWLAGHGATSGPVWLVFGKRASGVPSPTYDEAVEAALCEGWVDGQKGARDERTYVLRFSPRRPRSPWSQVNVERVARLLEQGRMRPAGLAAVERARRTGQWDRAYAPQSRAEIPPDLQAALDADPAVAAAFAAQPSAQRYAVLYRLQDAKRPQTRARRLAQFVERLAAGRPPV